MFNYSIKVKIAAIVILIAIITAIVIVYRDNKSKGFDLYTISYAKNLGVGLEHYFSDYNSYLEISQTKLNKIKVITENGINQPGNKIYFRGSNKDVSGTLVSTPDRYLIEVNLENSWDLWGIDSQGGSCRISNNLEMLCR